MDLEDSEDNTDRDEEDSNDNCVVDDENNDKTDSGDGEVDNENHDETDSGGDSAADNDDNSVADSAENSATDNEDVVAAECKDNNVRVSEDFDTDTDDAMLTDLKNLFPDPEASPCHSQDSEEYFSPIEYTDKPGSSGTSFGFAYEGKHQIAPKQTIETEHQMLQDNGSGGNLCNVQNRVSVSVQCELLKLVSKAVQCEPIIQMTRAVQHESVLRISRGVQCEQVLKVEQCVQCEPPCMSQQAKGLGSKSICKSSLSSDIQPNVNVNSVGLDCNVFDDAEIRQSTKEDEYFTSRRINLPPLQDEIDATDVVSSSQITLLISDTSSCESPDVCENEILPASPSSHSSKKLATCHEESSVNHNEMQVNSLLSPRSASDLLVKKNAGINVSKRKTRRSRSIGTTECFPTTPNKLFNVDSFSEYSSQELLLEMESPRRHSQESSKNNKCVQKKEEISQMPRKSISGQKSHNYSSEQENTSKGTHASSLVQTENMEGFPFNSMACERASSPESLDDDTCNELTKITTRGTLLLSKQRENTDLLVCSHTPRKEIVLATPLTRFRKRCDIQSPNLNQRKASEELPGKRKRMSDDTSNLSASPVSSKTEECQQLVPYSDSDSDDDVIFGTPDLLNSSKSRISITSRTTLAHLSKQESCRSPRKNNETANNTPNKFSVRQKLTSPAKSTDSGVQRSTSSRHSVRSALRRRLCDTDVQLSDSDSDIETVSRKTSHSKGSQKSTRNRYTKWERDAIVLYIIDHKYFKRVKGREMWERMESANICPSRTWQSMKEHFLKQILPKIESYHLDHTVEARFINARK